jgi:hypothetical protein
MSLRIPDLPLQIPTWYLQLTGAIWGIVGIITSYGIFFGRAWGVRFLKWGSLSFILWYWIDRLALVQSEYGRSSWPAAATLSLLSLLVIYISQKRSEVKAYYQEKN